MMQALPFMLMLVASVVTTACAPSAETDDENANELIDLVVQREAPFHQCVEIGSQSLVVNYPTDYQAPIMGLYPGAFSDVELNAAASSVAVNEDRLAEAGSNVENTTVVGEPDTIDGTGSCTMLVHFPIVVEDYAFVEFSAPGGDIGAYAFQRKSGRWRVAERLHFGWW